MADPNEINMDDSYKGKEKEVKKNYKCSVVMVVKNVEKDIHEILTALKNQTVDYFEIIIIDSSSDETGWIIKSFLNAFNGRLKYRSEIVSIGKGRQLGVELSETDTILFIDGDCIPPYDWVEKLYNEFTSKNCDILHCNVKTYPDKGFWYKYIGRLYEIEYNFQSNTRKKLYQLTINDIKKGIINV